MILIKKWRKTTILIFLATLVCISIIIYLEINFPRKFIFIPRTTNEAHETYGPFEFDNIAQVVHVSVSDKNWGVLYLDNENRYKIVINNKLKETLNDSATDNGMWNFKVTDNFYGYFYKQANFADKIFARINNKTYGPFDKGAKLTMSNNYWAITYFNESSQTDKSLINGKVFDGTRDVGISDRFWGVVYTKKDHDSVLRDYIIINNKKYGPFENWKNTRLIIKNDAWLIVNPTDIIINDKKYPADLGETNLEICDSITPENFGCAYPINNHWEVIMYDKGQKKHFGPYGHYDDPREMIDFMITEDGFMFNHNDQLVTLNGEKQTTATFSDPWNLQSTSHHTGFRFSKIKSFVNVDNTNFGPYDYIDNFNIVGKNWYFEFLDKEKSGTIINGKIAPIVLGSTSVSENRTGHGLQKDGKLYIEINKTP